ncbi:MAG: NAD-dependent epimerase/dehydratase family protein [Candidatus Rokubacteria bacterium]|nr:NAD-dependent epimerase/dehydratase family protein [Candidatus Rokubacteria bacterium]
MSTVLVTGGAGFLGSHLVDRLLADGASVRVLDNLSTGSLDNLRAAARWRSDEAAAAPSAGTRLEVILGDIRDRELVRRAMRRVAGVFHLAALPPSGASFSDPAEFHTVNVQGTLNVLEAALAEGAGRVVFASCASVYGSPSPGLVMEDGPVQPASLFAASKLAGEMYCRVFYTKHGLETVALRYFTVYGPRQTRVDDSLTVSAFIDALRRRRPVMDADAAAALDFTYVDDAVDATVAAATAAAAAGQTINVGSGQTASVQEVLSILSRLLGLQPVAGAWPEPASLPRTQQPQASRAAELLGYVPRVSLVSGLSRVVQSLTEYQQSNDPALAEIGADE